MALLRPEDFTAERGGTDSWRAKTTDGSTWVSCGGDERGPDPARLADLEAVVSRLDAVLDDVRRWAAGLPPDTHVPFERRPDEGFRLRICGLDGDMGVLVVVARAPDPPGTTVLVVSTGLPDGYADYRVTLDGGRPVKVTALV